VLFMAQGLQIIYDGDCPFCSGYVRLLRLREAAGAVELIDARSDHPQVMALSQQGVDFNAGMALLQGGQVYLGAECLNRLALQSTRSSAFNRLNAWVFKSPRRSAWLYPLLRRGRILALRLLGRAPIGAKT
jgi:predicted DCC family thiol-disulfide oxidoreductase YuxK